MNAALREATQTDDAPAIHAAIAAIMGEIRSIPKTRQNTSQNYKFRGIADFYLVCQPLMAKHGVHVTPAVVHSDEVHERPTKSGGTQFHVRMRIEFRFYASDGSWVPCVTTGEAMDSGDKASNKAMSAAMKYALIQTFCIPEDDPEIDTEAHTPEVGPRPLIADAQVKVLGKIATELQIPTEDGKAILGKFGFASRKEVTTDKFAAVREAFQTWKPQAKETE
jgi:hypothetical protein